MSIPEKRLLKTTGISLIISGTAAMVLFLLDIDSTKFSYSIYSELGFFRGIVIANLRIVAGIAGIRRSVNTEKPVFLLVLGIIIIIPAGFNFLMGDILFGMFRLILPILFIRGAVINVKVMSRFKHNLDFNMHKLIKRSNLP